MLRVWYQGQWPKECRRLARRVYIIGLLRLRRYFIRDRRHRRAFVYNLSTLRDDDTSVLNVWSKNINFEKNDRRIGRQNCGVREIRKNDEANDGQKKPSPANEYASPPVFVVRARIAPT